MSRKHWRAALHRGTVKLYNLKIMAMRFPPALIWRSGWRVARKSLLKITRRLLPWEQGWPGSFNQKKGKISPVAKKNKKAYIHY